jgi:thiamine-phosphate pyrophosphorylase
LHGLYAIADTGYLSESRLTDAVAAALAGGARAIQYRDKSSPPDARRRQALALASLCQARGALFVVNDDAELAHAVDADGVHIGRADIALAAARRRLGGERLIGVSCYNDLKRAQRAAGDGADYVAFGSFFPSRTKPGALHADPSLLHAARVCLSIPLVAIGGITPENGAALVAAGADALAVISGVFDAPDVAAAARRYAILFGD